MLGEHKLRLPRTAMKINSLVIRYLHFGSVLGDLQELRNGQAVASFVIQHLHAGLAPAISSTQHLRPDQAAASFAIRHLRRGQATASFGGDTKVA